MISLLQSEWFKLRKSKFVFTAILLGPFITFFYALTLQPDKFGFEKTFLWEFLIMFTTLLYALYFLPLATGILAGLICRYEHQSGGWKQLLAMPVTRNRVFLAKYTILVLIVFAIQLLYLLAIWTSGVLKDAEGPFPMMLLWKSIFGGWIATFPLLALQLWMSMLFKSFAAPFAVNVIFTLPAILAVNSEKFGPLYPWAQPFLMMYVSGDAKNDTFFVPWEQVLTVAGGSFLIFFFGGLLYFRRKENI
jgi:lantibiotic transport system permease protein